MTPKETDGPRVSDEHPIIHRFGWNMAGMYPEVYGAWVHYESLRDARTELATALAENERLREELDSRKRMSDDERILADFKEHEARRALKSEPGA